MLARIVDLGHGDLQVTVSAVPTDMSSAETRTETVGSVAEAVERRNYLVMSLATGLRARGHEVEGLTED